MTEEQRVVELPLEIAEALQAGDYATGFQLLKPLAETTDTPLFHSVLGLMYSEGWGTALDYAEAVRWLRKAAEAGVESAQFNLGLRYQFGQGVPQDFVEAAKWYEQAAEQGHGPALVNLAALYEEGHGVPRDTSRMLDLIGQAARLGIPQAQYKLGLIFEANSSAERSENYVQAAGWFRAAAEQNFAPAQAKLGMMHHIGQGVEQDNAVAVQWLQRAASQNDPIAQFSLGYLSRKGLGVPQDDIASIGWYRKAAEQGYPPAQGNLGFMYQNGLGTPQDLELALFWYGHAAANGNDGAADSVDVLGKIVTLMPLVEKCSPGDISILAASLDNSAMLTTRSGSANDCLWTRMADMGWTRKVPPPEELAEVDGLVPRTFDLTDDGRMAVARLISVLAARRGKLMH